MTPLLVLALWAGPVPSSLDLEVARAALSEEDRALSRSAQAHDLDHFLSLLCDDVSFLTAGTPLSSGKPSVREAWRDLFEEGGPTLSWNPDRAAVARSGDIGYTVGTFSMSAIGPDGKPVTHRGEYVTVWRREPEGSWKVLFDVGRTPLPEGALRAKAPVREVLSKAGDLAAVVGTYELQAAGAARPGKFLALRERQLDGSWKLVIEAGNPNQPPPR